MNHPPVPALVDIQGLAFTGPARPLPVWRSPLPSGSPAPPRPQRQWQEHPAVPFRRSSDSPSLLPELLARRAADLSVGQQQRVAAARALIGRLELVAADEPTSALDADRQQAFLDLLVREWAEAGAGLLFISHDLRLASRFDWVVHLADLSRAAGVAVRNEPHQMNDSYERGRSR